MTGTRVVDGWPGPASIDQVAFRAGVSKATVSRALRGLAGVSPRTRSAVEQAAADLGYVPSALASALSNGYSRCIAVVAPWLSRWFFTAVIEGAHDALAERGYDILLSPLGADAGMFSAVAKARTLYKRIDGMLALSMPVNAQPGVLGELPVPVVTVGSTSPGLSGVLVDDERVGFLATRHLLDLGHRRIAFLGLDPDHIFGYTVAAERHLGYCQALTEAGLVPDPGLTQVTGFSTGAGEAALEELFIKAGWDAEALPTGVVAVSDEVALGVIYAARKRGLRVPEDLSVIGVDDHDVAYLFDLTTIGQPAREQGSLAGSMLLDQLSGPPGQPIRVVQLQVSLIRRNTTATPHGRAR